MGQQRYSPEFKDEAVRQVTERGHSLQEDLSRVPWKNESGVTFRAAKQNRQRGDGGLRHVERYHG